MTIDPARLEDAIATVAAMTEDEFYAACEAIRLDAQRDNAYWANQHHQEQHQ